MRFATLMLASGEQAAIQVEQGRWVPLHELDTNLRGDLLTLILDWTPDRLKELEFAAGRVAEASHIPSTEAKFVAPYRKPCKILGIGLNYLEHARDLGEERPDEPVSFIKGHHTIIGPGDPIELPTASNRVTTEAELGFIVGKEARRLTEETALSAVFGVCAVLDQTAEDILSRNPRFLTRSKNFPTFLSFGPEVVTVDEFLSDRTLGEVTVTTVVGSQTRTNSVSNMAHSPQSLLSFHSAFMPWYPGDLLSSGTPGAIPIGDGDLARCEVDGLLPLENPVSSAGQGM